MACHHEAAQRQQMPAFEHEVTMSMEPCIQYCALMWKMPPLLLSFMDWSAIECIKNDAGVDGVREREEILEKSLDMVPLVVWRRCGSGSWSCRLRSDMHESASACRYCTTVPRIPRLIDQYERVCPRRAFRYVTRSPAFDKTTGPEHACMIEVDSFSGCHVVGWTP